MTSRWRWARTWSTGPTRRNRPSAKSASSSLSSADRQAWRLVLASSSPQRRELLERAGHSFVVRPAPVDEIEGGMPGSELALANARLKARAVAANAAADEIVLAADTVVELEGRIYGQPVDAEDARRMLRELSGSVHRVHTGVCVIASSREVDGIDTAAVTFRVLSDEQIDSYLDLGEWKGRAGGYAIQESADSFSAAIEGCFQTVVGLPMDLTSALLAAAVQHD